MTTASSADIRTRTTTTTVVQCFNSFQELVSILEELFPSYVGTDPEEHKPSLEIIWKCMEPTYIADELGRLRIWCANIGAHRTGRSSLDFRLRDASNIKRRVLSLLDDLNESLNEGNYLCVSICIWLP